MGTIAGEDVKDVDVPSAEPIGWYDGERRALRPLFEEAEDSGELLDAYIGEGRVLVARAPDRIVGHLQLVGAPGGAGAGDRTVELKNMAVIDDMRGRGVGRRLVEHAIGVSRDDGCTHMVVATAAADIGNLRFYQRCGFRLSRVERDAFDTDGGYEAGQMIDGIPLRDRVWFSLDLRTVSP
jgi:GNAT superfamily N-acetyltransferase